MSTRVPFLSSGLLLAFASRAFSFFGHQSSRQSSSRRLSFCRALDVLYICIYVCVYLSIPHLCRQTQVKPINPSSWRQGGKIRSRRGTRHARQERKEKTLQGKKDGKIIVTHHNKRNQNNKNHQKPQYQKHLCSDLYLKPATHRRRYSVLPQPRVPSLSSTKRPFVELPLPPPPGLVDTRTHLSSFYLPSHRHGCVAF